MQPQGRPLHRPDRYMKEARAASKATQKSTWYRAGGYSTVLFVPPTPGSSLANQIKTMEENTRQRRDWSFRVVELGGRSLKTQLQTPNPGKPASCGAGDCLPCLSNNLGSCGKTNICYKISCTWCLQGIQDPPTPGSQVQDQQPQHQVYIGESSRSMRVRSSGHVRLFLKKDKSSPLWKHSTLFHRGSLDLGMFNMKMATSHRDPLSRQVTEGVLIKNCQETLMNSRAEYKQPRVNRIRVERTLGEVDPPPQLQVQPRQTQGLGPQQQGPTQRVTRARGGGRTPPPT